MDLRRAEYLIKGLTSEVVELLVSNDGKPVVEAVHSFLNSQTYDRLRDPMNGLYTQSPQYLYNLYKNELKYGKLML